MVDPWSLKAPPFCPNQACRFHRTSESAWRWVKAGFFPRACPPRRVQRYQCLHCRRYFSDQTFRTTYWLKQPTLLGPIFHRLVGCSCYRQIAREFGCSASTIARQAARLGRHCLLVHEQHRPQPPIAESVALDSFISFEWSQYYPSAFHVLAGRDSHFFYGFTDSELRRSGRMTKAQKRRRAELEEAFGRPDTRSIRREVTALLQTLVPEPQKLELHSDRHEDYPRALKELEHLEVDHRTISSRAARTAANPLFPINLLDLLIRHSGSNHKRETIAFSKRRQSAAERLAVFLVWRNYVKSVSEQKQDGTPAMRLKLLTRKLSVPELLKERRFPGRIALPKRWARYYWREIKTRALPNGAEHRLRYAA